MATRSGSVDPGVLLYLLGEAGLSPEDLERLLYNESGLLGLSGLSGDMRTLLASDAPEAREAIDYYVFRVNRELGALMAVLGGLDALVFTAGVGENSAEIRRRICHAAAWTGLVLSEAANRAGNPCISEAGTRPSAWVIPTDEEQMIARHTLAVLGWSGATVSIRTT
jgi:acetate kinase